MDAPYTGWTRAHWENLSDRLVSAVWPYAGPDHALPRLPGPVSRNGSDSDALEAFARSMQLAAVRLAGSGGEDPLGAVEWYSRGLAHGTDPDSPGRWPAPRDLPQAKVEAASIALSFMLAPSLWEALTPRSRGTVTAWLEQVVGTAYPPINWVWFQLVVEAFLRQVGGRWSRDDVDSCLAVHESLYECDGWYRDGPERAYDHYSGWALQVYPALLALLAPDLPGVARLVPAWRERLHRYLDDAVRLIGADGSPLIQGRSLIYRFGAAGPLWAGALSGATPLSPGLTRRAASGMVRHFVSHGVPGDDGLLTVGWHREFPAMRQNYSGSGSPYWAGIGMLGLMLPADDPVWTSTEEPLPIECDEVSAVVRAPGWLVSGTRDDGIVRIVNHGTDHAAPGSLVSDSPWYAKLAYSTAVAPDCDGFDNTVTLIDECGQSSARSGFVTLCLGGRTAVSRSRAHWMTGALGPWVTVGSVISGAVEVRAVRVDPEGSTAPCRLRLAGWSVPIGDGHPGRQLGAAVRSLAGFTSAWVTHRTGVNQLAQDTAVAWVSTQEPVTPGRVYLAAVVLTGHGDATTVDVPVVRVTTTDVGDEITVHWPDGATDTLVLPFLPISSVSSAPSAPSVSRETP